MPLARQALSIIETTCDADHPDVAFCLNGLATILLHLGQPADALPHIHRALTIRETTYGPRHPHTAHCRDTLAAITRAAADGTAGNPLPGQGGSQCAESQGVSVRLS